MNALTEAEYEFLDDFFDLSIEGKRVHGGNPTWLWGLARKILGPGWVPESLSANDRIRFRPEPHSVAESVSSRAAKEDV